MLNMGLGLGALLFAIGLITYYVAPRVGPNPIFGVRVGYSYASRDVWDKSNRAGGILFCVGGVGIALLGLMMGLMSIPDRDGVRWLMIAVILVALGGAAWLFWYARQLASGSQILAELKPVSFRWALITPVLVPFAILVLLAIYVYPSLPVARMATHFDFANQPDGWMPRDTFLLNYLGIAALVLALDLGIVLVATREPLIAFGQWGTRWQLNPEQGLMYAGVMFGLVLLLLAAILWDVARFNISGMHAFPLAVVFGAVGAIIVVATALFFTLAKRSNSL